MLTVIRFWLVASACIVALGCAQRQRASSGTLESSDGGNWQISNGKRVELKVSGTGECADLGFIERASFPEGLCFNEEPIGTIAAADAQDAIVCVATHESGGSNRAHLLLVDSNNEIVGESFGKEDQQILGFVTRKVDFKVYLGFPKDDENKEVTVRSGSTKQFKIGRPACLFI